MKSTTISNLSILVGALIIAGALVYLGNAMRAQQSGAAMTPEKFETYLNAYVEKQQKEQANAQEEESKQRERKAKDVAPLTKGDHVRGPKDARITIYEYSDFECPFCKRFNETPGKVIAANAGKVNAVYRHFPLGFHDPLATKEAVAAECAAEQGGTDAFYAYHDAIFKTTKSNGNGMKEAQLTDLARAQGLNVAAFEQCRASGKFDQHVKDNIQSGIDAGVTGTPGVIIKDNKTGEVRVMPGAVPVEAVQAAVDELLAL